MKPSSRGIDVVAFSGTRVWSRVIRLRSLSKYSHVGIVCEIDGDDWVIEALEGKGVRVVPLRCWYLWAGEVTSFAFSPETFGCLDRQAVIDFAKSHIGQEYASPWQFLRSWGLITRTICRWLGIRKDLESDRWFCSELVAGALDARGFALPKSVSEMTPGDVCRLPYIFPIVERTEK